MAAVSFALAALGLAGCASSPPINYAQRHADAGDYNGNAHRSQALNVAVATGLTECKDGKCAPLSDVPRLKLPESLQGVSNAQIIESLSDAWALGSAVGHFTGVATALPGLSNFGSGLFMLGSFLLGPTHMNHPASQATMLAWMPKSMAEDKKQAWRDMIDMVRGAYPREIHGYHVADLSNNESIINLKIDGKASCEKPYGCGVLLAFNIPGAVGLSPAWLEQEPSYVWTNWHIGSTSESSFNSITIYPSRTKLETHEKLPWPDDINSLIFFAKLSENLPKWVYIYLPPTDAHNYPVMLNQGKPLLFIEPLGGVETASEQALP